MDDLKRTRWWTTAPIPSLPLPLSLSLALPFSVTLCHRCHPRHTGALHSLGGAAAPPPSPLPFPTTVAASTTATSIVSVAIAPTVVGPATTRAPTPTIVYISVALFAVFELGPDRHICAGDGGGVMGRWSICGVMGRLVGLSVSSWVRGAAGRWVSGSVGRWGGGAVGRWVCGSVCASGISIEKQRQ